MYLSVSEKLKKNGIALIVKEKKLKGAIVGYETVSTSIIKISFNAKPTNINDIHVYAPTVEKENETTFYLKLTKVINKNI